MVDITADFNIDELSIVYEKLLAYTCLKFTNRKISKDKTPEEFVQDAFKGFLLGNRNWNKERYPELIDFLRSVIDSAIYNYTHSKRNKKETNIKQEAYDSLAGDIKTPDLDPLEKIISEEDAAILSKEILSKIREIEDENLELYFMYIQDGYCKPNEVSVEMGIPVDEIYYLSKKLRRITSKIIKNKN